MNKQVYIDKIAIITDELQQITSSWLRNDYQITELEVENYLSNIRYLTEQSALLKRYLLETDTLSSKNEVIENVFVEETPMQTPQQSHSMDDLHMHISEVQVQKPVEASIEESISEEQTLHQKLSAQVKENSIADVLKNNYFNREITFSLNEKILFIQQLFNGDEKDFNKVIAHLSTLDSMEEVDFYLNATCVIPYDWANKAEAKSTFYQMLESRF